MSHGPDTPELMRRIQNADENLDVAGLNITSLPPLPNRITYLDCFNTRLTSLPPLPDGLRVLICTNTPLTSLPPLPDTLTHLYCHATQIPDRYSYNERMDDHIYRVRLWQERVRLWQEESRMRIQERASLLKEELVAAVWHPRRVQRLIDICGEDFDFEML
jgi:hypothetical protein